VEFPVDAILPRLIAELTAAHAAVLVAEPGAGKTTRVPPALLLAPWLAGKGIVMLEPRRLAAQMAARRMATMEGEEVGGRIGYAVRFDRKVSALTRIEVVTEGILTRRLQADPELAGIGLVILDEFHERSLASDLALTLLQDIRRGLREDLRILVMSATLDADRLSEFLGGAPVITATGRQYPVETRYLGKTGRHEIARDCAQAARRALAETTGSILVFLPGEGEIRRCADHLAEAGLPNNVVVRPLYGAMPLAEQNAAIAPAAGNGRKVVLATTIAETSLTIEGISAVVDCGYRRSPRFDPASGMTSLELTRVSLAAADQRRGRAGRLGPGVCYRLWPEAENRALRAHDDPEIAVADLAPLLLEVAAWGVADPTALSWLTPLPSASLGQARDVLRRLEALDADGRITAVGRSMVRLPLHPRLAHMALRGASARSFRLAAFLSEIGSQARRASVDIATCMDAVAGSARERMDATARQLRRAAGGHESSEELSDGVLVALAWPDRIAQRRGGERRYRLSGGGGAILPEHDPLAAHNYLAVALTDGSSGDQKIHLAAPLGADEIERHFADQIEVRERIVWDGREEMVLATRVRGLGAIVLEERQLAAAEPEKVVAAMIAGIGEMGLSCLPWNAATGQLRARVAFLRKNFPELPWPDLSDAALRAGLSEWLAPYLTGMTRRSHLERLDLRQIILALVPRDLVRRIDVLAPARIAIPSGAEVTLDYEGDGDPVLRARLQEMFGLARTPTIADGRVKLRVELMSPAGRPLAVTQSLETFWTNAYPSVRADMRGRYPKHAWPDNPLETPPVKPRRLR
jgi:ATP-dependent helicase HrpB